MGLWITLVLVDLVTVATFARCFTGPGELLLIVPVCLLAHLVARAGRIVGKRTSRLLGAGIWLLAVVLVAWVPVVALDWHSLSWGLPLASSQHALASQFHTAWAIFSNRVAPVVENRGLVIAAAWASGAVGLAAEALDADEALPAIVALIPAFDIVVFTGTLGTSTARGPELAALAAFAVAYLALAARRAKGEQVVTARVEGSAAATASQRLSALPRTASANGSGRPPGGQVPPEPGRSAADRWRRKGLGAIAAPGLVVIAAVSAGVVGPLLPGARSPALVAWHGGHSGRGNGQSGPSINRPSGPIIISSLVQVGEEEIDNPGVALFDEYSAEPTREVLATLDIFNGNQWLPGGSRSSMEAGGSVPTFDDRSTIKQLERSPEPLDVTHEGTSITQVIKVLYKTGDALPIPGEVTGIDGLIGVTISPDNGEVLAASELQSPGETYAVRADINPGWGAVASQLRTDRTDAPAVDTSLPRPVPARISGLANQWTAGASSPLQKALLIQDHLTGGQFHYALPRRVPAASNSPAEGYAELSDFLFRSRTGYCQQFASAFAVMARIEGLPTRVVVGLLPGTRVGHGHEWQISGTDVHAWPQVYFKGTGWVDFEPTPGSPAPVAAPTTTAPSGPKGNTSVITAPTKIPHSGASVPRLRQGGPGGAAGAGHHSGSQPPSGGGAGFLDVVLGLLAAAALWALFVPTWRIVRLRRAGRDPLRGVLAEWGTSMSFLGAAGLHRRRAETFDEYARRVRSSGLLSAAADDALSRLVRVTNQAVFGGAPPTLEQMKGAVSDASVVRRSVRKSLAWWHRVLLEVDPRDLVRTS